jgi:hypothetical protein
VSKLSTFTSIVKNCIIPINVYLFSSVCYGELFQNLKLRVSGVLASQVRASAMLILLNVRNSKLKHVPFGWPPVAEIGGLKLEG